MHRQCPGCLAWLEVDEKSYEDKALLQCPECLYVFLARSGEGGSGETKAPSEPLEEATLLTSDFSPQSDAREFQWNVPGASLTIIEGDSQGIHLKLSKDRMVIGRQGADLALEDKSVSRTHCELVQKDDGFWLSDLGSKNGTFLNGEKIEEARLSHLDEIRVGQTMILFAEAQSPAEAREPEDQPSLDQTKVDEKSKEPMPKLPAGREFILEFMTGPKKARSVKIEKGRIIIGRGDEADLKLEDQGVSRKHTMIEVYSREQVYISDLASHNGTWLNGTRIRTTRLLANDLIRIGNTVLKFIVVDRP
jgi:pSer/pThr/pTyr-binding forkhead associated (FHA) protein